MFDVGFAEIFLLSLIGLLVLGPERLPGVARTIGGFVRKARTSWISLRNTIESELEEANISEPIKQASDEFKQIGQNLKDMPGLSSKDHKSGTTKTESSPVDTPDAVSVEDSDSGKSE